MDTQSSPSLLDLAPEIVESIVAASDGKTKNNLTLTCKLLHACASFANKERLLKNSLINLGPIEKHLLLIEYIEHNNVAMVSHMFGLGASYDTPSILEKISIIKDLLRNRPHNRSLPACIITKQTCLHVAVAKRHADITEIILSNVMFGYLINNGERLVGLSKQFKRKGAIDNFLKTKDKNGNTALDIAVANDDDKTVQSFSTLFYLDKSPLYALIQSAYSNKLEKILERLNWPTGKMTLIWQHYNAKTQKITYTYQDV